MQVSKGFNLPKFATIDSAKFFDPIRTPRTMVATPINTALPASPSIPTIEWVNPPDNFVLDDKPVQNNGQPPIADALKESLELAGRLPTSGMVASNISLSVQIDGKLVLIAPPAWLYISHINEPDGLFLGVWQGIKENHNTHWLRWWDAEGNRLPWAIETA
jgi:hypothetical protein